MHEILNPQKRTESRNKGQYPENCEEGLLAERYAQGLPPLKSIIGLIVAFVPISRCLDFCILLDF